MSWRINNLTAPDSYTPASTLDGLPLISRINVDTFNQAIYWQLKQATNAGNVEGMATWQDETYQAPGSRALTRPNVVGFRFRAATPLAQLPAGSSQAQVTVEAIG